MVNWLYSDLLVAQFVHCWTEMPGLVATFVSVEIIFWNEINVVKDETVESVNFHGLFDSDVHDSAFVEYVVAKLKSKAKYRVS